VRAGKIVLTALIGLALVSLALVSLGPVHLALAAEPTPAGAEKLDPDHAAKMTQGLELFKRDVRSVLVGRCVKCHGGETIESEFSLMTRELLLKGGAEEPAVVLGKSKESRLYKLIAHLEEPHMPDNGAKLSDLAISQIAKWIDLGAPYDKPLSAKDDEDPLAWTQRKIEPDRRQFWSFQPLTRASPPAVKNEAWCRTPIDRFVLAKLQEKGIQPNAVADRRTLVRRAYFDLIGLPPTSEEVEKFVNDPDADAYSKLIDRLLESPHYGERWGRHWLDVARFAESHGFEQDYDRPHAYHYRDFVIKALNSDMPYDQFVRWQVAGDEIAPDNPLAMMATGFLGAGVFPTQLTEKEFEPARYDELDDMAGTLGTAMLGLTIGCARCHDHKFDPIPQADYYRLTSTFATTIRSNIELNLNPEQTRAALAKWQQDQQGAKPQPKLTQVMVTSEGFKPIPHHADGRGFPHFYKETYFLNRGDVNQKQGEAGQGFLQVLIRNPVGADPTDITGWQSEPAPGQRTSFRRESLTNWLTDVDHGAGHLLARVVVNRLWQHHLGRGIVATPNDFGFQGQRPSHPELLDWLANELMAGQWRLKPLHKRIMTSAAYMQTSDYDAADAAIDPDNQWCWRHEPQRLEAEIIRDSMLAVSGRLDRTMFGPGTLDETMQRRSIYFMVKRSKLITSMQIFDAPEPLASVGDRPSTTIAPQALLFMNNPQVRSSAVSFAQRLQTTDRSLDDAIQRGYLATIAREPTTAELNEAKEFLQQQIESYTADKKPNARELALADFCQVLLSLNEFIYIE
jgi:cytochrome c553